MTSAERVQRIETLKKLAKLRRLELETPPNPDKLAQYSELLAELERITRIEAGFQSIMTFAQTYFMGEPPHDILRSETPSPPFHYELADYLREAVLSEGERKTAIAAPRSHAKSSLVTNIFPLWLICYSEDVKNKFLIIIGDKQENARKFLDVIKMSLEANERLIGDFGNLKGDVWNAYEITTSSGCKISAHGSTEGLRGLKHGSYRPGVVIMDDIESEDSVSTGLRIDKMVDWFDRTVLPLSDPKSGKFFIVGTVISYTSLLNQILTQRPDWNSFCYRAIEQFPDNMDLWNKFEEIYHSRTEGDSPIEAARLAREKALSFYEENKDAMHEGAEVLWPERMDLLKLMELRTTRRLAFLTEYLNSPVDETTRVFRTIHYYDINSLDLSECTIYGACDPSIGRTKRSDPSAIITIARHNKTGVLYVIDADARRRHPDQIIRDIFQKARIYNYQSFSIEAIAFQEFMASELQRRSAEQHLYLPIKEYKSTVKKEIRISSLEPLISNGLLRFSQNHRDLVEQLEYWPRTSHEDLLDCCAQCVANIRGNGGAGLVYAHI